MILTAFNPSTENLEKTYFSKAYPAGSTTVLVRNSDRFVANGKVLLGEMGNEKTEIGTVSSVTDVKTLVLNSTTLPHSASDAIYVLKYDQVKFYRSTTTIDGAYSELATVNMDVDNADLQTKYDDASGISSYFYKVSYYNSVLTMESDLSDAIPGTGYSRDQVGAFVQDFLTDIGDTAQEMITIPQVLSLLNECNDEVIGQSKRPYRFLKVSATLTLPANSNRVALPDDLWKFDTVAYNRVDGIENISHLMPVIPLDEMDYRTYDNNELATDDATFVAIDETTNELVFRYKARTLQNDALKLRYYRKFKEITSLSDKLETLGLTRMYKMYLLGRFYRMRAVKEQSFLVISDRYLNDYTTEVVKLQRTMKLDVGTPHSMQPSLRNGIGYRRL